jgi:hypothetical protein
MRTTTKDGRTILTGRDYTEFRHDVWDAQEGRCLNCGRSVMFDPEWFQVHHKNGRGGGKRTDTLEACAGLCRDCHMKAHGVQW